MLVKGAPGTNADIAIKGCSLSGSMVVIPFRQTNHFAVICTIRDRVQLHKNHISVSMAWKIIGCLQKTDWHRACKNGDCLSQQGNKYGDCEIPKVQRNCLKNYQRYLNTYIIPQVICTRFTLCFALLWIDTCQFNLYPPDLLPQSKQRKPNRSVCCGIHCM